jgi:hypothetical protein
MIENMRTNWKSRIGQRLAGLFELGPSQGYFDAERDADWRRIRTELDAIRVHFPDHA